MSDIDFTKKYTPEELEQISTDAYKRGIVGGSTLGVLGAGTAVLGHSGEWLNKKLGEKIAKDPVKALQNGTRKLTPEQLKNLEGARPLGYGLMGIGAATAGYSAYKHYKNKK